MTNKLFRTCKGSLTSTRIAKQTPFSNLIRNVLLNLHQFAWLLLLGTQYPVAFLLMGMKGASKKISCLAFLAHKRILICVFLFVLTQVIFMLEQFLTSFTFKFLFGFTVININVSEKISFWRVCLETIFALENQFLLSFLFKNLLNVHN